MFRPSLKSGWSLTILFFVSLILFAIAQSSYIIVKTENYDTKVSASILMKTFMDSLKTEIVSRGIEIDPIDDPLKSGLIGTRVSSITTDKGLLSEKQAAINPNLAAVFVEEFTKLRLNPGDYIAVGSTGSNPAVNLALYAAIKTMRLKPVIITAVSSASYGANKEMMTWLDMEASLRRKKLIDFSSSYASLGGKEDLGIGLSDNGIKSLQEAMQRNVVPQIIGSDLKSNIETRMAAYQDYLPENTRFKAFVNIGAGLANVGSEPNAKLIPEGINHKLAERNYETEGVAMLMAKNNVPVLNFRRVLRWTKKYDLPSELTQMPKAGEGKVFSSRVHNVWISAVCLLLLVIAVIIVIIFDRHDRRFMANIVDPDEEL
ncbi:MAG TPA: poly-gamma-glutamate system protein [Candidatus Cloacimonadota bacterium]|nr:poly-gamma-glutamate system protein [Candidatus Cloacimonadota bacterium]